MGHNSPNNQGVGHYDLAKGARFPARHPKCGLLQTSEIRLATSSGGFQGYSDAILSASPNATVAAVTVQEDGNQAIGLAL